MILAAVASGDVIAATSRAIGHQRALIKQSSPYCPLSEEHTLLELINAHREVNGRQPLVLSATLGAAARHHAESMAAFDYFDYSLLPEGIDFAQNIAAFGYEGTYLGANIAAGPSSDRAATVFSQWLASPSQRENLLNPGFVAIGLGSASNPDASFQHYWVATFGDLATDPADAGCATGDGAGAGTGFGPAVGTPGEEQTRGSVPEESPQISELATEQAGTPDTFGGNRSTTPTTSLASPTGVESRVPTVPASPVTTPVVTLEATGTARPPTEPSGSTPQVDQVASPFASPEPASSPVETVSCEASRQKAQAADRVVVSCSGFEPGATLELYWDQPRQESKLATADSGSDGRVALTFLVPETPAGRYVVIVRGGRALATATTTIEVQPGLFLLPMSGDPGDVVTADLTGFQPGEAVTLNWYVTNTETRVLRVVNVGEDGSLTTTFRAPASTAGPHTVSAVGISGGRAETTFVIEDD